MGRPYASEIDELYETYRWGMGAPVDSLVNSLRHSAEKQLIAIGSGGSLTSAHFASLLHTRFTGQSALVLTPYEFMGSPQTLNGTSVLICSAGGSNPDVLACAEHAADRSPDHLFAITTRTNSALNEILAKRVWPSCHEFATPTKKDGFLATNSLLATIVLLTRAYHALFDQDPDLPKSLEALLHPGETRSDFGIRKAQMLDAICDRPTLVVLHGSWTKPAAADLESRYTEAALGSAQVADFRNFAHGRHHWLAVHADSSAVVAFASAEDNKIAQRTLSLIPKSIPRQTVSVADGLRGSLIAVCESLFIALVAGSLKGIDPGRPKVPMFGRKLYHLKASPDVSVSNGISKRAAIAIERKSGFSISSLVLRGELDRWTSDYADFVHRLQKASFRALICDYDGTLCGPDRRLLGPREEIIQRLTTLIEAGIPLAIATGRGKSVRETLRQAIKSSKLRKRVIIGYHNCAEIGSLDDVTCPPDDSELDPSLVTIADSLKANSVITRHAKIQAKRKQIAIELQSASEGYGLLNHVSLAIREAAIPGPAVVTSTHSIDVLAPGVSKQALINYMDAEYGIAADSVLCIGDRGRWPGNDWELLRHMFSLSVDQVSQDPATCWNLSSPENRFDLACNEYLQMLAPKQSVVRFDAKRLKL